MSIHKNQYQSAIHTYLERRQALQEKYGKRSEKYRAVVKNINRKLDIWRCSLRRIERREKQLKKIDELIQEFMGCPKLRLSSGVVTHQMHKARATFYKHCLENSITGNWLALYVGAKDPNTPGRARKAFTASFKRNKKNHELWHRWKLYLKDINEDKE